MGSFLYFIVHSLLELLVWAIIISAILSWLVAWVILGLNAYLLILTFRGWVRN